MASSNMLTAPYSSSTIDMFSEESFEDACSICLEPFSSLDPPAITNCKHEYHLHCILEWSQRSYDCPICSQRLLLKDPACQELLAGAQNEKNLNLKTHSSSLPVHEDNVVDYNYDASRADVSEFEQRIMRQFSAVASRARDFSRRRRDTTVGPSQVLPSVPSTDNNPPSDQFQAFSESLKSKISTASAKYKESISKSTRDLKEKLVARNDSVKELTRGVQREMTSGIAGIARMIEKLDFAPKRAGACVPHSTATVGTSNSPHNEANKAVPRDTTMESSDKSAREIFLDLSSPPVLLVSTSADFSVSKES